MDGEVEKEHELDRERFGASMIAGLIITILLALPVVFPPAKWDFFVIPAFALGGIFITLVEESFEWIAYPLGVLHSVLGHTTIVYFCKRLWEAILLWLVWIGVSFTISAISFLLVVGSKL